MTKGIVCAVGRDIEIADASTCSIIELTDLIQTDCATKHDHGGGPLLNGAGEVIGIHTAVATSAENLGFARPINAAVDRSRAPGSTDASRRAFLASVRVGR